MKKELIKFWRSVMVGNDVFLLRDGNNYYIEKLLGEKIFVGNIENLRTLGNEIKKELGKK